MRFNLADESELDGIFQLFRRAINRMDIDGIPQWDKIYPSRERLGEDIALRQLYLLRDGGSFLAAVALNEVQDPGYENGRWQFEEGMIACLHRLCVDPLHQGRGVAHTILSQAEQRLRELGYSSVRLDAFSLNPPALRLYESSGYARVGEALFRKGLFYLFEKKL